MTTKTSLPVVGLAELLRNLNQLPDKIQRKVAFGALRASAAVVVRAAKGAAPARSGMLKRSIKASSVKLGRKGPVLLVVIGGKRKRTDRKTKEKITEDAYYARWVELGTKAHEINTAFGPLAFGGRLYKKVRHPGARATHFFEKAIDSSTDAAIETFATQVRARMDSAREASNL